MDARRYELVKIRASPLNGCTFCAALAFTEAVTLIPGAGRAEAAPGQTLGHDMSGSDHQGPTEPTSRAGGSIVGLRRPTSDVGVAPSTASPRLTRLLACDQCA